MCSVVSCFFFKQKTAYEMRISDWSSDVCSSDLRPASAPVPPSSVGPLPDIIVTAQKRPQILTSVPLSVSIISLGPLASGSRTLSSRDISFGIEGMAKTNLGTGSNRQIIHGVAESPVNGKSQYTVAVLVDEARVTFDAPEPDHRQ